jgi:hypothetical protein
MNTKETIEAIHSLNNVLINITEVSKSRMLDRVTSYEDGDYMKPIKAINLKIAELVDSIHVES